jgi:hypothetical protein
MLPPCNCTVSISIAYAIQKFDIAPPDDGLDKPKRVVTSNIINYTINNRCVLTVTRNNKLHSDNNRRHSETDCHRSTIT